MAAPKLRFKEFVNEICYKELGSLITLMQSGLSRQLKDEDIGLPVLRSNNIQDFRVDYQDIKYWYKNDPQGADTKNYLLKHNDLLVNFINSMAQIGKSAIYNGELGRNAIITTNLMRLQFNNLVIPKFISYYFQTKQYEDYIQSITKPAVNQASFTTKEFQKLKVPYFSIEEQTKIASFLSNVDEKISQLTQKHELLSQYKQGMMQKLFSQQIRFKADDGSEFGEWEVIQANQIFENYSNKNHDGTLTILAATQDKGVVPRDEIDIDIKSSDASVLSYKIIEKGNFVISLRSFQGGIEYSNYHGICSPAYTILKSIKPIASGFYKNYLKTNDFIQRLSATVIGIRDGKQISYQAFSTLMIDYPSVEEQTKIADFLSAIDQKIEVVTQQIEQAKTWKKGLLQQMFV